MKKSFWYAVSMLTGTIVGVGMFALPYSFYKAGFFVGLSYLFILFFILLYLHLMMGEIVLRTNERHRFLGYVGKYLGDKLKNIAAVASIIGLFGGLLAYILISGSFLKMLGFSIFSNIEINQILFWIVMSIVVFFGVSVVKKSEFILVVFMVAIVIGILINGLPYINIENFLHFNLDNIFLPYGIVIYSLVGLSAIPLMRDFLVGEEKVFKKAIFYGVFISVVIYLLFVTLVVGVSGDSVSEDAIVGLSGILGDKIIFLGAVLGLLAVSTSYVAFAVYIKQTLILDFNVREIISSLMVFLIPIISVIFISIGLTEVVMFLGVVFLGIDLIFLILVYNKAKKDGNRVPEYSLNIPKEILYLMAVIFMVGIFYELFYNL
ncbi:MAG: aromatic amino acid transport family protein [Patescibacteria group bacterium]